MKKNRLLILTPALLGMVIAGLTGCAGHKRGEDDDDEDPTKANITVATLDKGIGTAWLENAAREFEELYKDSTDFQEGRTGVKVSIQSYGSSICWGPSPGQR